MTTGATDGVTLRPARMEDAVPISRLVTALGYETAPDEMAARLATIAADQDYRTLVAARGNDIVGVAGVRIGPLYEKSGPYGQLMLLAVTPSAQGQGVGRALIEAVEAWVRERGGIQMVVHSGDQRPAAHRFYERFGYADTGRRFIKPLQPDR